MTVTPEYGLPLPPNNSLIATFPQALRQQSTKLEEVLDEFSTTITDWKGWLAADRGLKTVTEPGRYGTVAAHEMGLSTIMVSVIGTVVLQNAFTSDGRILRRSYGPTQGWTDWAPMGGPQRLVTSTAAPLVFAALATGSYQVTRGVDGSALGMPTGDHGKLVIDKWTTSQGEPGMAIWVTRPSSIKPVSEIWTTDIANNGTAVGWVRVGSDDDAEATAPDMGIRHGIVRDWHAARIGAPIDVGTATPLAIVWDDWPALMLSLGVITMHQDRDLPITLALPSRVFQEPYASELGGTGATPEQINTLLAAGGVEIANHSATHRHTPPTSLHDEVVTAQAELRAMFPGQAVDTWVMPTVTNWAGFPGPGATADEWASEAGQLILGHHAYATGKMTPLADYRAAPMTGTPLQGQDRIWVEAADLTTASRQNLISRHYGTRNGAIISAHANPIGATGRWTLAEVEAFLDWIATERDAGRIAPMFLSEWAWAKSGN